MLLRLQRGLRRVPRPFFVLALLAGAAIPIRAQDPMRPWLRWRTIATPNYRFHFAPELEGWTKHVAARVEGIDAVIASLVGYSPDRLVHVVVDDPFGTPNGYVLPAIERPTTVWWAMPPDPRNDIGNYGTWGELLAVHELTHVAHLTRPSRNPLQRRLWSSLPTDLGPIARKAPRWVFEGYATVLEGRITGTGRPNNAWRPAMLRQWAIEGRLPSYSQLNGWDGFAGGEFAYLGGSALLEWLLRREGDSSLVHVWRRLTARTVRSFDASFTGVFGDSPALLYGRHVAELTSDAMAAKAELERAGLVEGELVQRLAWGTGDPAVSPNGELVAVTLRERDKPGRVVVWRTAAEPEDTAAVRKRIDALKRDPQDVPDRRFHPRPKKAQKTLSAVNGRSFQQPRWFDDGRRLLLTRWTPRSDGTVGPQLYIWNTEAGGVRRATSARGVLHGDPAPGGRDAIAMQCHRGHCDIARVNLGSGAVTTLAEGSAEKSYYRPRYSPDGNRIAASVTENGRWRVVVMDRSGRDMRYADPDDDGANRYDVQWAGPDSLVAVSELGGIANLELIDVAARRSRALTRVTGAAVAPDVNRGDGSVWFLNLHSLGFDVRRLPRDAVPSDSVVSVSSARFGFAGTRGVQPPQPAVVATIAASRAYGAGPRHQRWLPGGFVSADGAGGALTIFSGDVVGRLNATVTGAYGQGGTWQGGSLRSAWRFPRPAIELGVHGFLHEPSLGPEAQPGADSLDVAAIQSILAVQMSRVGDGWHLTARAGGSGGTIDPQPAPESHFRGLGFAELELRFLQSRGARGLRERLRLHATQGSTRSSYRRAVVSAEVATAGRDLFPIELGATYGRLAGSPHPFEQFAVGGVTAPVADSSLMSQRFAMPMFPTATALGPALLAWRIALPSPAWTLFYEGASTSEDGDDFRRWHRAAGAELRFNFPPVPVAFTPRLYSRVGAAYLLDAPFRNEVRGFLEMRMEP